MSELIDIGNVRGIQGEKGDKGEKGSTPSYNDIKYNKKNGEFVRKKGTGDTKKYYTDGENFYDEEGNIYDNTGTKTGELESPFDLSEYDEIWKDTLWQTTNENNDLLDETGEVQYEESSFISDILSYLFNDPEGFSELVHGVSPDVVKDLISADPTSEEYENFFKEIEGDMKYYVCYDNPKNTIILDTNDNVLNTCRYYDDNGELVNNEYVPLEKNALYLYNNHCQDNSCPEDNERMHYEIYLCLKANTIPKKIISSNDFQIDYNVIDALRVDTTKENEEDDEYDVELKILTRGTRGQFYSMDEVDDLFETNVTDKLGVANGIAQLGSNGKILNSQLPAFVEDIIEGTMNNAETVFTPTSQEDNDLVENKNVIYSDTTTGKTYRWSGSQYVSTSSMVEVDDNSNLAYGSAKGTTLENKIGTGTFTNEETTIINAINNNTSEINSLDTSKQNKTDNTLTTTSKTIVGAINEIRDMIYPVGAVYLSVNNTNPKSLFGGHWKQLKDRFLLGVGDTYNANETGGEATHTLTTNELPAHRHELSNSLWNWGNQNATESIQASTQPGYWGNNALTSNSNAHNDYFATQETGNGQAHNNMPPYQTVYIWERVDGYYPKLSEAEVIKQYPNSYYVGSVDNVSDLTYYEGCVLAEGWDNTGLWELSVDIGYMNGLRNVGLVLLASVDNPYGGWGIRNWEGSVTGTPTIDGAEPDEEERSENFTKTPDTTLTDYNGSLDHYVSQYTLHMNKTSMTTLEVWKNDDTANKVVYEWEELSDKPQVTMGAQTVPEAGSNRNPLYLNNLVVRYTD